MSPASARPYAELEFDPALPALPALKVGARIVREAQEAGLIVRPRGDIVTLAPPFVVSEL